MTEKKEKEIFTNRKKDSQTAKQQPGRKRAAKPQPDSNQTDGWCPTWASTALGQTASGQTAAGQIDPNRSDLGLVLVRLVQAKTASGQFGLSSGHSPLLPPARPRPQDRPARDLPPPDPLSWGSSRWGSHKITPEKPKRTLCVKFGLEPRPISREDPQERKQE